MFLGNCLGLTFSLENKITSKKTHKTNRSSLLEQKVLVAIPSMQTVRKKVKMGVRVRVKVSRTLAVHRGGY